MTQPGELRSAFSKMGFLDVTETMLTIRMDLASFDDCWNPMIMGQGTHAEFLNSLPEPTRRQIESAVRTGYLCGRSDGPRSISSVAWAVRGMVARG